ncbi:MAG: hypothetical protein HBSAPP02_11500 [Phycisphaerae bacterium]|nr:MAG: hypothetical protein HBSAPP02_11500 [Phycisphaerae bacterium]
MLRGRSRRGRLARTTQPRLGGRAMQRRFGVANPAAGESLVARGACHCISCHFIQKEEGT